jgi:hypothetical protein
MAANMAQIANESSALLALLLRLPRRAVRFVAVEAVLAALLRLGCQLSSTCCERRRKDDRS